VPLHFLKKVLVIIATTLFCAEALCASQAVVESDSITQNFLRQVLLAGSDFSYPDEAAKQKQGGTCHCAMFLLPDGTVKAVAVRKSSGHPILDAYVTRTLKGYRCKPGTQGPIQWFITFSWPGKIKVVAIRF
jgi:TonB family protein